MRIFTKFKKLTYFKIVKCGSIRKERELTFR